LYRLRDIASYWSKIAKNLYTPPVFSAPNFAKMFDAHKTRMIGRNCDDTSSRCRHNTGTRRTDHVRTDSRTERIPISISRVSVMTRDNESLFTGHNDAKLQVLKSRVSTMWPRLRALVEYTYRSIQLSDATARSTGVSRPTRKRSDKR